MLTEVILANAARIWDIGGLEYPVIKELLDQVPRVQLAEIEQHSEVQCRVRLDTDAAAHQAGHGLAVGGVLDRGAPGVLRTASSEGRQAAHEGLEEAIPRKPHAHFGR